MRPINRWKYENKKCRQNESCNENQDGENSSNHASSNVHPIHATKNLIVNLEADRNDVCWI